jgi:hypothetical protein
MHYEILVSISLLNYHLNYIQDYLLNIYISSKEIFNYYPLDPIQLYRTLSIISCENLNFLFPISLGIDSYIIFYLISSLFLLLIINSLAL